MKLTEYAEAIASGWTKGELTRAILHDLPRRAVEMEHADREIMLNERPAITATRWDALLAAMVEHVAQWETRFQVARLGRHFVQPESVFPKPLHGDPGEAETDCAGQAAG